MGSWVEPGDMPAPMRTRWKEFIETLADNCIALDPENFGPELGRVLIADGVAYLMTLDKYAEHQQQLQIAFITAKMTD